MLLQASERCFVPKAPPRTPPNFQPADLLKRTRRVAPSHERPASAWQASEAYLRTGTYCSDSAPADNGLAGAHRRLPLFAADATRTKKGDAEGFDCTKHQNAQGAMSPGVWVCSVASLQRGAQGVHALQSVLAVIDLPPPCLCNTCGIWHQHRTCSMLCSHRCTPTCTARYDRNWTRASCLVPVQLAWCAKCQRAVAWQLMADGESANTPFEMFYLFFRQGVPGRQRIRAAYDAGCHLLAYALNRDPEWTAKTLEVLVDSLHYAGHTTCAASFNTGALLSRCPAPMPASCTLATLATSAHVPRLHCRRPSQYAICPLGRRGHCGGRNVLDCASLVWQGQAQAAS